MELDCDWAYTFATKFASESFSSDLRSLLSRSQARKTLHMQSRSRRVLDESGIAFVNSSFRSSYAAFRNFRKAVDVVFFNALYTGDCFNSNNLIQVGKRDTI